MVHILYLFPRKFYDSKMSIGRVMYGQAVAAHPQAELKFWGPGWPGWRDDDGALDNLRRLVWRVDWLWIYKGEDLHGIADVPLPKVVVFNEAHHKKTFAEVLDADADLVVFHHQQDRRHWQHLSSLYGIRLATLPHGAPAKLCYQSVRKQPHRTCDALLSGVIAPAIYPVRAKLHSVMMSESFELEGVRWKLRPHPGYRLRNRADCLFQYVNYVYDLCDSRLALCCTSKYRYCLAKLIESQMCGALLVSDAPDDEAFQEIFGEGYAVIDANETEAEIARRLRWWLCHPRELRNQARKNQILARKHYSLRRWADRFLNLLS